MGMFDYVRCEVPLPDGWEPHELQSKDFDCIMTNLRISEDGRLLVERYESYVVPKKERPYPDAPEGSFLGVCGSWGKRNRHWDDLNYHGDFNFYGIEQVGPREFVPLTEGSTAGYYKGETRFHDYIARFTDGKLVNIATTPDQSGEAGETPKSGSTEGESGLPRSGRPNDIGESV